MAVGVGLRPGSSSPSQAVARRAGSDYLRSRVEWSRSCLYRALPREKRIVNDGVFNNELPAGGVGAQISEAACPIQDIEASRFQDDHQHPLHPSLQRRYRQSDGSDPTDYRELGQVRRNARALFHRQSSLLASRHLLCMVAATTARARRLCTGGTGGTGGVAKAQVNRP